MHDTFMVISLSFICPQLIVSFYWYYYVLVLVIASYHFCCVFKSLLAIIVIFTMFLLPFCSIFLKFYFVTYMYLIRRKIERTVAAFVFYYIYSSIVFIEIIFNLKLLWNFCEFFENILKSSSLHFFNVIPVFFFFNIWLENFV